MARHNTSKTTCNTPVELLLKRRVRITIKLVLTGANTFYSGPMKRHGVSPCNFNSQEKHENFLRTTWNLKSNKSSERQWNCKTRWGLQWIWKYHKENHKLRTQTWQPEIWKEILQHYVNCRATAAGIIRTLVISDK